MGLPEEAWGEVHLCWRNELPSRGMEIPSQVVCADDSREMRCAWNLATLLGSAPRKNGLTLLSSPITTG